MSAHPLLIGIVNAVVPGVGYIVLKERIVFGWLLIASILFYIPFVLLEPQANYLLLSQSPEGKTFEGIAYLLGMIAFGYDAFDLASKKVQVQEDLVQ